MALERVLGRYPDRAYLYFLRPNEPIEVDMHPLALNGAREAVRSFKSAQQTLDFPLRTGEHCVRCEHFKGLCPAGKTLVNIAGSPF
jgi:hypothetical protein